ncbi:nicotinate-nucleotide--dimethylbenzimidazole phosphoribosyltransferase [soil metagenome]
MIALEDMLADLPQPDREARVAMRARADAVLRPAGALARLDEIAVWLAGWQGTSRPSVVHPWTLVFVADHGVASAEVSAYPTEVTKSMLAALESGVATASAMSRSLGARFAAIDVGVGDPTGDIRIEPALTHDRAARCVDAGRAAVERAADQGADLLVLGEMGIANTTVAAAVCATLFGGDAGDWAGRGTGVDDDALARQVDAIEAARSRADGLEPLDVLREAGGAELVAIAAAVMQARRRSIGVVLDGFVVGASVAPLHVAAPGSLDHCLAGHRSAEPGHSLLLERLQLDPIVDLGLRLGEASGALVALPIIRLAAAAVSDVATFEEWGLA